MRIVRHIQTDMMHKKRTRIAINIHLNAVLLVSVVATTSRSQKNKDTPFMSITSQNVNQFSKVFHCETKHKICYKIIVTHPTTP